MAGIKTLFGLLIVAGGLVYYLYMNETGTTDNAPLISTLNTDEASINSIDRVVISHADQQFDMRKELQGWRLNDGFYVRRDSLVQWLLALKNARRIETKTANPDNFQKLSLTEEDLRVQLYRNQQLLADVILGQSGATNQARFVRFYDDNQSWLVSGLNELNSSQEVWQLSMILDVPESQVQAIEWMANNTLNLIKDNETGQWQQADNTTAKTVLDQDKIKSIAASLSGFRIQQAFKTTSTLQSPLQRFVFGLNEGRRITLSLYRDLDKTYVVVDDSQYPGRYKGWHFTVPDYKLSTLQLTQSVVLNPPLEDDGLDLETTDKTTKSEQLAL